MPLGYDFKNVGEPPVPCYTSSLSNYGPHTPGWTPEVETIEYAKEQLKELARDLDLFNKTKKELEREKNIEAARYYRELISDWTKQHRALKLALGWFLDEPSLPYKPMRNWPLELVDELDRYLNLLSLTKSDLSLLATQGEDLMATRRETLSEAVMSQIEGLVAFEGDGFSELEKTFIEKMVDRDKEKKSTALVQIADKLKKLENDLNKINRPDNVTYDKDRKPVYESYSKARLDEIEKLNKQINKHTNAMEKALTKDDWNDLYNLAGGKDTSGGEDKGGDTEKSEG
jgi:hypothetical protein